MSAPTIRQLAGVPAQFQAGKRLAAHLGVPGKYHRTLTEALVRLMAASGAASPALSWEAFRVANPQLMEDARSLLARHYSDALLASSEARAVFVAPDRLPLPA